MVGGRLIVWLRTQVWVSYKALQPNQRSYLNAFAFLALFLIFRHLNWELKMGFQMLAIFFLGMAMISDLLSFYKQTAETLLGKLFYLILLVLGTNVAIAIAAQVLNSLIGVDPGQFTRTITFTSVLLAPLLLLLASSILLSIGTVIFMLFFLFQSLPDENSKLIIFPWYKGSEQVVRYRGVTAIVQAVSLIAFLSLAYGWYQAENTAYEHFIESKTKWFLYNFEMFERTQCQIEVGQKVASLGDGQVLVGSKEGGEISFVVQRCSPSVGKL
ncbi:hypothetical protein AX279_21595 [Pseudomonas sp. J237]|nr:hypothetical protein AX279_21595 [Pseudomonas sp. J237]